jgi:protoheme IX farnesyltransferase
MAPASAVLGLGAARELSAPGWRARAGAFVALTKPRIVELLLVTTVPTMIVAAGGWPSTWAVVATLAGGALAAGGANAGNMFLERDLDSVMRRTSRRPLVTGAVKPHEALVFATGLEVAAFLVLALAVNLLAAGLALAAAVFYVGVYTALLKRHSPQNIVIGGAAGAMPVLVGWVAVRGSLDWAPVLLAGLVFLWTPPHFWSLAVRYREDYSRAGVPMMPVVRSLKSTGRQVLAYSVLTVAASAGFGVLVDLGWTYWAVVAGTGGALLALSVRFLRSPTNKVAMQLFHWSITYLFLLFASMAVDVLAR